MSALLCGEENVLGHSWNQKFCTFPFLASETNNFDFIGMIPWWFFLSNSFHCRHSNHHGHVAQKTGETASPWQPNYGSVLWAPGTASNIQLWVRTWAQLQIQSRSVHCFPISRCLEIMIINYSVCWLSLINNYCLGFSHQLSSPTWTNYLYLHHGFFHYLFSATSLYMKSLCSPASQKQTFYSFGEWFSWFLKYSDTLCKQ